MIPRSDPFGACYFSGWARMGCKIDTLSITEVSKPNLGEKVPAFVTADVVVNLSGFKEDIRNEWEELREHDVLFLVSIQPPMKKLNGGRDEGDEDDDDGHYGNNKGRGGGKKHKNNQKKQNNNNNKRRDEFAEIMALKHKLGIQAVYRITHI
jgi:hypothetical protein